MTNQSARTGAGEALMNWMLDQLRSRQGPSRPSTRSVKNRRPRLAVESLEGRSLLTLSSFFAGLFPTYTSTSTTNATTKDQLKVLRQPTDVTFPPYTITLSVANASAPGGTGVISGTKVTVQGIAPPNATVWLAYGPLGYFNTFTKADANGYYFFDATVPQNRATLIRTFAESIGSNYSEIASVRVTSADPIVTWDALALKAIANLGLSQEGASRDLAILHIAQYDAIAATSDPNSSFAVTAVAPAGSSPIEAANAAAETVLTSLFPTQAAMFSLSYAAATADLPSNASISNGAAVGSQIAQKVLAARSNDGSTVATASGVVANPNWNQVQPFSITSASEFRPAAPPAAGTAAYDQALSEVTQLGQSTSTTRTAAQTAAAQFWDDPVGTATDPGHWNAIAEEQAIGHKTTLLADARLFAELDVAMADAAIASFDAKEAYDSVRPITAIQATDPTWTPLLGTPATPSYVSEHAAFGAAASDVLAATYGNAVKFTTQTNPTTAIPSRTYPSFAAAATEEANSRVAGGVSFRFDTTAGASVGGSVAKAVLAKFPKQ